MKAPITCPYYQDFLRRSKAGSLSLNKDQKNKVYKLTHHWLKGADAGWNWASCSREAEIVEAADRCTLNEALFLDPECDDPHGLVIHYPGFYPETDFYFENFLKVTDEFEMLDFDGTVLMNAPFRAFWDGWIASVRYHLLNMGRTYRFPVGKYWLKGSKAGWQWAKKAAEVDLAEVAQMRSPKEVGKKGCHSKYYSRFYPGTNSSTAFFSEIAEEIKGFEADTRQGGSYSKNWHSVVYDGWLAAVREYFLLSHLEQGENTPDHWARRGEYEYCP